MSNQYLMELVLLFLLALILATIINKMLIKQLVILGVIDKPSTRRLHQTNTPRGGGLSVVLVLLILGSMFDYFILKSSTGYFKLLPPLLAISAISFLDDIKNVHPLLRLIVHTLCASVAVSLFLRPMTLSHGILPIFVDAIFAIIGLVAFLNIYNFLDGIDGITAIETIHLSTTILLLCYLQYDLIISVNLIITVITILLACSISFLIFNWHPAQIFIGDIGTISIGFLIGICLLLISASSSNLFVASVIASLYYLADGILTILIRFINGEKIWKPHLKHFFQIAIKNGMMNSQVIWRIIICNFCLMIFSILALHYPVQASICACAVVSLTLRSFKN